MVMLVGYLSAHLLRQTLVGVIALATVSSLPARGQTYFQDPLIIDGDTFYADGGRVRLLVVDAPEDGQKGVSRAGKAIDCGSPATATFASLAAQGLVCEVAGRDMFGRRLAQCRTPDRVDVGLELIRQGVAFAYPDRRSHLTESYERAQHEAKAAGRGLWEDDCQLPWRWRRENRGMRQ